MINEKLTNEELAEIEAKEAFEWYMEEVERISELYPVKGLDGNQDKTKVIAKQLTKKLEAIREKYGIKLEKTADE